METIKMEKTSQQAITIETTGIKDYLQYGDQKKLAQMTGCSATLVKKVLNGDRKHEKGKGRQVIELARHLIEVRLLYVADEEKKSRK